MTTDEGNALVARDGDVLVVSYPKVKVPLAIKYSMITFGGLIYTRRLLPTDDVGAEYDRIYDFLRRRAERDVREKVRAWNEELTAKSGQAPPPPPKPSPGGTVDPGSRSKPEVRR